MLGTEWARLDLLEGSHIHGLNVVLSLHDLLLESLERDKVILDDTVDLKLLDAVTDRDELGLTPQETIHLDATNMGLKGSHVGLIIPRLDVEGAHGLGSGLGLKSLLGGVLSDALLLDLLGLLINLIIIGTKEVDFLIILLDGGGGSGGGTTNPN